MSTQYLVGPSRAYTTIGAAISAIPSSLIGTGIHEVIIDAGSYSGNIQILKTGASASDYINMHAASGSEHKGSFNAGVIISTSTFATACVLTTTSYTVISDIVMINTGPGQVASLSVDSDNGVYRNIICSINNGIADSGQPAVAFDCGGVSNTFICCLAIPNPGIVGKVAYRISNNNNSFYNCAAYNFLNCFVGFSTSNSTFINCWAFGTNCFAFGNSSSSNNASTDNSASGINSLINKTVSDFSFVNISLNNFHITPSSVLKSGGLNNSTLFTTDWDHEVIIAWPIGPDYLFIEPYLATSSEPWENKNAPHEKQLDAKSPQLKTLVPEPVQGHGIASKGKEAQNPVLNKQNPEAIQGFNFSSQTTNEAKASNGNAKKGYVNGFVSVMAEAGGYGRLFPTLGTGQMVYLISDALVNSKTYTDRNNVRPTRAVNQRVGVPFEPHGNFVHELRSNDAIAIFQSHFQNRIGTTPASGTTYYEFTPFSGRVDLSGSNFGTGSYTKGTSQAFTVSVFKAVNGTGFHYKSGVCKSLKFNFDPMDSVQLESDYSFGTVSIVATNTGLPFGQYSTLPNFPGHKCSINFFGLPLTNFAFECNNNMVKSNPVGGTLCYYKFGRYDVTGAAWVDIPPALFQYYATMLANTSFPVYGTMFNDDRDKIIFQMDNCRLDSFEYNLTENLVKIPFHAYESEDGSSPPIKFRVWTHNYSATTFEPN